MKNIIHLSYFKIVQSTHNCNEAWHIQTYFLKPLTQEKTTLFVCVTI